MESSNKVKFTVHQKHGLAVAVLAVLLVWSGWKLSQNDLVNAKALESELPQLVSYIRSFPVGAPVVLFGLVFLQGAVPLIPFFLLAGASGIVYGMFWGLLIVWSGGVLGACATFAAARYLGKARVEGWLAKRGWNFCYTDEQGFLAILVSRVIPVLPSVAVNVISGISKVRFAVFALATAVGKLPWAFLYTSLGYNLKRGKTWAFYLALAGIALLFILTLYRWLNQRSKVKTCH